VHPNLCIAKLALRARALAGRVVQGGLTPRKLALTLCLGTAVGVMPLLWGTTILCALCAVKLKLNQGAVQAVNYFCYPLQLALLLPFCRLGEFLFPWGPAVKGEILSGALHGNIDAEGRALQKGSVLPALNSRKPDPGRRISRWIKE